MSKTIASLLLESGMFCSSYPFVVSITALLALGVIYVNWKRSDSAGIENHKSIIPHTKTVQLRTVFVCFPGESYQGFTTRDLVTHIPFNPF